MARQEHFEALRSPKLGKLGTSSLTHAGVNFLSLGLGLEESHLRQNHTVDVWVNPTVTSSNEPDT